MESVAAAAAAEHVLTLFDTYWFHHQILSKHHLPTPPPSSPPSPMLAIEVEDAESRTSDTPPSPTRFKPPFHRHRHRHRRSLSDDASPESPNARPSPKLLQTILSGKVAAVGEEEVASSGDVEVRIVPRRRDRRGRRSRAGSKSLTDLEFEELKGLRDLGFTFSDAEADPRLIAIVPGLQRLRAAAAGGDSAEASPSASDGGGGEEQLAAAARRPYLSEAWESAQEEEDFEVDPLRNWRIPAAAPGVDMKDHLRFWAHAVASTVR